MPGMYFFNCNGPVQVGPFGNCSEARQDAENRFGGPCQFLGCTVPPCGCAEEAAMDLNWAPDEAFLKAAALADGSRAAHSHHALDSRKTGKRRPGEKTSRR